MATEPVVLWMRLLRSRNSVFWRQFTRSTILRSAQLGVRYTIVLTRVTCHVSGDMQCDMLLTFFQLPTAISLPPQLFIRRTSLSSLAYCHHSWTPSTTIRRYFQPLTTASSKRYNRPIKGDPKSKPLPNWIISKPVSEARFFMNFEFIGSMIERRELLRYFIHDIICDIIN